MSENKVEKPDQPQIMRTLRDAVRLRPGMYLVDSVVFYHLLCNVLDHAVNEAAKGTCSRIEVILYDENIVTVRDNGSGLPIDIDPETGQPFCYISPVGEPSKYINNLPKYSFDAASFSLGLPATNAACGSFRIEVKRNGFVWQQEFKEGLPLSQLKQVRSLRINQPTGMEVVRHQVVVIVAMSRAL